MAVKASIIGHLVLTSLHTNDALSAIIRLIDMGIEPYMISSALSAVQSQRLVKKLCRKCAQTYEPDAGQLDFVDQLVDLDQVTFKKPVGCDECIRGYKGRQAISEVFTMEDDFRMLTKAKADIRDFRGLARGKGFKSFIADGLIRASQGELFLDDVLNEAMNLEADYGFD